MSTGQSGSGLCLTRTQPEDSGGRNHNPQLTLMELQIGRSGSCRFISLSFGFATGSKYGWILDKNLAGLDRSGRILAEILSDLDKSGQYSIISFDIWPRCCNICRDPTEISLYRQSFQFRLPVFGRNTRSATRREKGIRQVGCFSFLDRQIETRTDGIGSLRWQPAADRTTAQVGRLSGRRASGQSDSSVRVSVGQPSLIESAG